MRSILTTGITSPAKLPFTKLSLEHLQTSYKELIEAIVQMKGVNDTDVFFLNEFDPTRENIAYHAGNVYLVPTHSFDIETDYLCVYKTTYYNGDAITYSDGVARDTLYVEDYTINIGTSTGTAGLVAETGKSYTKVCNLEDVKVIDNIALKSNDWCGTDITNKDIEVSLPGTLTFTDGDEHTFEPLKLYRVGYNTVRLYGAIRITGSTLMISTKLFDIPSSSDYWDYDFRPASSIFMNVPVISISDSSVSSTGLRIYGKDSTPISADVGDCYGTENSSLAQSIILIDITYTI